MRTSRFYFQQLPMTFAAAFAVMLLATPIFAVEENPLAPATSGEVEGTVQEKGKNFIRVKLKDTEKSVRFTPVWSGGAPKDGGGLDKKMVAKIRETKPGAIVKINWKYEERPRVLKLEIIKQGKAVERERKRD